MKIIRIYGLFLNDTDFNTITNLIVVSKDKKKLYDHYKTLENDFHYPLLKDDTEIEDADNNKQPYYTIEEVNFIQ